MNKIHLKHELRSIAKKESLNPKTKQIVITVDLDSIAHLLDSIIQSEKQGKEVLLKPRFYDTKFRQLGRTYGELVDIQPQYNCPRCNGSLWLNDKFDRCTHCGQALNWSECKYSEHLERWI